MKLSITELLCVGIFIVCMPTVVHAKGGTGFNDEYQCYLVDRWDSDSFYFCGSQSKSCRSVSVWSVDAVHWHNNGDYLDREGGYYCCMADPAAYDTGRYVSGTQWIVRTENTKKEIKDTNGKSVGTCTWEKRINVCGWVDNPQDECTEPSEDCQEDYVTRSYTETDASGNTKRKTKCVKACKVGYVYASENDDTCVQFPTGDPSKGIKNATLVSCAENELWDTSKLKCLSLSDMVQVPQAAFKDCYKCSTPVTLKKCIKSYAKDIALDADTLKACGKQN